MGHFISGFRNETTGVGFHSWAKTFRPPPVGHPPHLHAVFTCKAEEFYVCIYATREGDYVLFHHEGGVDVGDVDAKAQKLLVGVDEKLNTEDIKRHLLVHAPEDKKELSSERDDVGTTRDEKTNALGSGYRREKIEWAFLLGNKWWVLLCPEEGSHVFRRVLAWNQSVCQPHPSPPGPCLPGTPPVLSLTGSFRLSV